MLCFHRSCMYLKLPIIWIMFIPKASTLITMASFSTDGYEKLSSWKSVIFSFAFKHSFHRTPFHLYQFELLVNFSYCAKMPFISDDLHELLSIPWWQVYMILSGILLLVIIVQSIYPAGHRHLKQDFIYPIH